MRKSRWKLGISIQTEPILYQLVAPNMFSHRLLVVALLLSSAYANAQPFNVGTRSISFYDPGRDRDLPCVVHYPAISGGEDAPIEAGVFPVLIHGHGFVMTVDAYTNLRDGFVPRGYILVLPTTEGGFSPAHATFGADLSFLALAMQAANEEPLSPFFGHVAPATALMGHSMGGGASMLAAAGNTSIQAVVNFAAAETNPSAINASASIDVPTLVFAATEDCITPPDANQRPMYDAVPASCKAYVNVVGGGHCNFASSSFTCSFGELTCGPDLTITREEQHDVTIDLAGLWLDHFLRDDVSALTAFRDSLVQSTRVIGEHTCLTTALLDRDIPALTLAPVPASDLLTVSNLPAGARYRAVDASGRAVLAGTFAGVPLDVSTLEPGSYTLIVISGSGLVSRVFCIMR